MLETFRSQVCPEHGPFQNRGITIGQTVIWIGCPKCNTQRRHREEREALKIAAGMRRQRYESVFGQWVPKRFMSGFGGFKIDETTKFTYWLMQYYAETFGEQRKAGRGFTLCGGVGTGKTHLACAVLLNLWPRWVGVYTDMPSLAAQIRQTWNGTESVQENAIMHCLAKAPIVVLDEVATTSSSFDNDLFFRIFDMRYRNLLPTICITNLTPEGFDKYCDERTASRLHQANMVLHFSWSDYRASHPSEIVMKEAAS